MRALLFDVDGTLAETEEAHRRAFNAAFRDAGFDWHWDAALYRQLLAVTGGRERIRHYLATHRPGLIDTAGLDERIATLHTAKNRYYAGMVANAAVPLRPGVARLLHEARAAGLKLAIATTTSRENIDALLGATLGAAGLAWFEAIGAGDEVAAKKPAPDVYLAVLARLALPPEACLAFEDSANGLRAARAAGIATVVTESSYSIGEDFNGALAVLSDLGEPDRPFQVRQSDAHGKRCVDVSLLRRWHSMAYPLTGLK